jgi:hypothetical protein
VAFPVKGGELPKGRGISHAFKARSPSSRRTQACQKLLMREILKTAPAGAENTKQRKRERAKQQKIAALKKIEPSMVNSILADFLKEEKVIFSNSTGTATGDGDGVFTHLLHTMKIVNDVEGKGCQLVDSDGNIVFLLYPREAVLSDSGKKAHDDVCALESLQMKKSTTIRSTKRNGVSYGKYSTTGRHANRGGRGIIQCGFSKKDKKSWSHLVQMLRRCEDTAAKFLPTQMFKVFFPCASIC